MSEISFSVSIGSDFNIAVKDNVADYQGKILDFGDKKLNEKFAEKIKDCKTIEDFKAAVKAFLADCKKDKNFKDINDKVNGWLKEIRESMQKTADWTPENTRTFNELADVISNSRQTLFKANDPAMSFSHMLEVTNPTRPIVLATKEPSSKVTADMPDDAAAAQIDVAFKDSQKLKPDQKAFDIKDIDKSVLRAIKDQIRGDYDGNPTDISRIDLQESLANSHNKAEFIKALTLLFDEVSGKYKVDVSLILSDLQENPSKETDELLSYIAIRGQENTVDRHIPININGSDITSIMDMNLKVNCTEADKFFIQGNGRIKNTKDGKMSNSVAVSYNNVEKVEIEAGAAGVINIAVENKNGSKEKYELSNVQGTSKAAPSVIPSDKSE